VNTRFVQRYGDIFRTFFHPVLLMDSVMATKYSCDVIPQKVLVGDYDKLHNDFLKEELFGVPLFNVE